MNSTEPYLFITPLMHLLVGLKIRFEHSEYAVHEDAGSVLVCATVQGSADLMEHHSLVEMKTRDIGTLA